MSRKKVWLSLGLVAAAACIVPIAGCGGGDAKRASSEGAPPAPAQQLRIVAEARLTDAEVAQLPADFVAKAATAGWKRVPGGFEKAGVTPALKITDGTHTASTDASGNFTLPAVQPHATSASPAAAGLRVVVGQTSLPLTEAAAPRSLPSSPAGGAKVWTLQVPYDCCAGATAGNSCCAGGKPMAVMPRGEPMDGRCLDYNGWWSDGGNYGKTDWRAYRNFVMSDCDRAFFSAGCWQDHYRGGCWAVHGQGGCSARIGHSSDYHKHNFPN